MPASTIAAPDTAGSFGAQLAGANDFDADGYADVAVGGSVFNGGAISENVYVFRGAAMGLGAAPAPTLTIPSPDPKGAYFGSALAGAADLNGDGFSDLVIGAAAAVPSTSTNPNGKVYTFHGSQIGLATKAAGLMQNPFTGANDVLGFAQELVAGDVNGDGYDDVLLGDSCDPGGATQDGRPYCGRGLAYVYVGGTGGIGGNAQPTATLLPPSNLTDFSQFGSRASLADLDGDGYADVILTASQANLAFVYKSSSAGVATAVSSTFSPPDAGGQFGESLALRLRKMRRAIF
jgi:hypothetical protein